MPDYVSEAKALTQELVALRREIHADPEVGLDTVRTLQRVLAALEGLDLQIATGTGLASVVAVLDGAHPGPTVIVRGDMDGLPVHEETGLPFASTTGTMHACGHDLHTVGVVGAAKLLAAHRDDLHGSVVFMFQPGEEGFGGARIMIEEGLLEVTGQHPVAAFAIHVGSGPNGVFTTRSGTACAGSGELHVSINGRGGHGSQPHRTIDPVPVAAEIVLALQTFVTRQFDAFDPVIVSVTQVDAGAAVNVIPERATLAATLRVISPANQAKLEQALPTLIGHIAQAHGCTADVEVDFRYPPTINDATEATATLSVLTDAFGPARVVQATAPMMGSEDFSFVLDEVPGTFLAMLASPPDIDPSTAEFNHSPRVLFDDALLPDQAAALATLAHARLDRERA